MLALNRTFGALFAVDAAEARIPGLSDQRAHALSDEFIMDMHTHLLRDDTRLLNFVQMRHLVAARDWNSNLCQAGEQTIGVLKFDNYFKEIFLDSENKIALISSAPSTIAEDWFLSNRQMAEARTRVRAAIMGQPIRGLGADHVCWGTDAVWTGSPQWQIEGLLRLEIPDDLQKRHGFAPRGDASSPVEPRFSAATTPGSMGWIKHRRRR